MKYRLIIVAIIHKNFKKVLLVKRARQPFKGYWSLSGGLGALEKQEDPTKAIYLEVEQDFGVKFHGQPYTFCYRGDKPQPTIALFFQGEIKGKPLIKGYDPKTREETISEIKWFDIKEASKLKLAWGDEVILKKFNKDFPAS